MNLENDRDAELQTQSWIPEQRANWTPGRRSSTIETKVMQRISKENYPLLQLSPLTATLTKTRCVSGSLGNTHIN